MIEPRKVNVESCIKNQQDLDIHPKFYEKDNLEAKLQEVLDKKIKIHNIWEKDIEQGIGDRTKLLIDVDWVRKQIDIMSPNESAT